MKRICVSLCLSVAVLCLIACSDEKNTESQSVDSTTTESKQLESQSTTQDSKDSTEYQNESLSQMDSAESKTTESHDTDTLWQWKEVDCRYQEITDSTQIDIDLDPENDLDKCRTPFLMIIEAKDIKEAYSKLLAHEGEDYAYSHLLQDLPLHNHIYDYNPSIEQDDNWFGTKYEWQDSKTLFITIQNDDCSAFDYFEFVDMGGQKVQIVHKHAPC